MVFHANWLKNIGDSFFQFDCTNMKEICKNTYLTLKDTLLSNNIMIYEELNVKNYMTKFGKIDISIA